MHLPCVMGKHHLEEALTLCLPLPTFLANLLSLQDKRKKRATSMAIDCLLALFRAVFSYSQMFTDYPRTTIIPVVRELFEVASSNLGESEQRDWTAKGRIQQALNEITMGPIHEITWEKLFGSNDDEIRPALGLVALRELKAFNHLVSQGWRETNPYKDKQGYTSIPWKSSDGSLQDAMVGYTKAMYSGDHIRTTVTPDYIHMVYTAIPGTAFPEFSTIARFEWTGLRCLSYASIPAQARFGFESATFDIMAVVRRGTDSSLDDIRTYGPDGGEIIPIPSSEWEEPLTKQGTKRWTIADEAGGVCDLFFVRVEGNGSSSWEEFKPRPWLAEKWTAGLEKHSNPAR